MPLDPGIGCITNGVKVAGQNSKLILTRSMYNVVIVLDMSASMFTVVSIYYGCTFLCKFKKDAIVLT